jgi:hypothetical protein
MSGKQSKVVHLHAHYKAVGGVRTASFSVCGQFPFMSSNTDPDKVTCKVCLKAKSFRAVAENNKELS